MKYSSDDPVEHIGYILGRVGYELSYYAKLARGESDSVPDKAVPLPRKASNTAALTVPVSGGEHSAVLEARALREGIRKGMIKIAEASEAFGRCTQVGDAHENRTKLRRFRKCLEAVRANITPFALQINLFLRQYDPHVSRTTADPECFAMEELYQLSLWTREVVEHARLCLWYTIGLIRKERGEEPLDPCDTILSLEPGQFFSHIEHELTELERLAMQAPSMTLKEQLFAVILDSAHRIAART